MATKTVGELIKEARTKAGLSQTALAAGIEGLSASDVGKAERGEKELTQTQLKEIAKATGVTQKSLLDAAKGTAAPAKKTEAKKTEAKKPASTAKKPASTAKKPAASAKKPASSTAKKTEAEGEKLTAAEKKLLELYRAADADTKKAAVALLKGEQPEDKGVLGSLLNMIGGSDAINGILNNLKK